MDSNTSDAFSGLLEMTKQTHPLFQGMDPGVAEQTTRELLDSYQALFSAGPATYAGWTGRWMRWQADMARLWMSAWTSQPEPARDARFRDAAWEEGLYPFLRRSYELTAQAMADMADKAGLPAHEQRKLSFYTRLAADAMAPSNFPTLNPEVMQRARETGGKSLIDGFRNMMEDLKKGYISTTDESAFRVGENLATLPGKVVFRNELIELIQYAPATEKVRAVPLLVVPPCVNKFYIFDINEKKSMFRHLVGQGQTVFTIAWRNPGPDLQDYDWDDYIETGIFKALEVTSEIMAADKVDILSFCNGATMLIAALAVMPQDLRAKVASASYMAGMIDFSDPGEVEVFVDTPQMQLYSQRLRRAKMAPGRDIARAMAMLHVNESIWNFVVGNYLKGQQPPPFDVLYWNADTSNLPLKWYECYIRDMYQGNKLREPGGMTFLGKPVDTRSIDVPCYFAAATGDHIVPWTTSYLALDLVSGESEFVLTSGGHVSGMVLNHPEGSRRYFLAGGDRTKDAEGWKESATRTEGSWWPHWLDWLGRVSGSETRAAPKQLGSDAYPPMEDAPGTYVHEVVAQDG